MAITRIATTKTITSVTSGTFGRARFTHASGTAVPVGIYVTNSGFSVGGYNVTQVVTASTATYYELTVAYSVTDTGVGAYNTIITITSSETIPSIYAADVAEGWGLCSKYTFGDYVLYTFALCILRVDSGGILTIANDVVFLSTCGLQTLFCNGGDIVCGSKVLINGQYVYNRPVVRNYVAAIGDSNIDGLSSSLDIFGSASYNSCVLTGGTHETMSNIRFHRNTKLLVDNFTIKCTHTTGTRALRIDQLDVTNSIINNLIIDSSDINGYYEVLVNALPAVAVFTLLNTSLSHRGTNNRQYLDLDNSKNRAGIDITFDSFDGLFTVAVVNASRPVMFLPRLITSTTDTRTGGYGVHKRKFAPIIKDAAGVGVVNALIYVYDFNNGNRKNLNGHNDTADSPVSILTGTDGVGIATDVILEIYNRAPGTLGVGTYDTGVNRIDRRTKNDTVGSLAPILNKDFLISKYGYIPRFILDVNFCGLGTLQPTYQILPDLGITQEDSSIVAVYTGFTVETSVAVTIVTPHTTSEVYDRRKYQESVNPAWVWASGTMCFSASGLQYDFDATYTLTLQAPLSGKVITGCKLVLDTGWALTAPIQDCTLSFPAVGIYDLREVTLTGTFTLINTSGGAVLVKLPIGTAYVNTGPNITVELSQVVNIILPELIDGSRVRVFDTTNNLELDNSLVIGGVGYSLTYTYIEPISILIYVTYQSGTNAKAQLVLFGNVSSAGYSSPVNQEDDTVYVANAIDGAAVTEFAPDYPNVQVDINDPDGRSPVQRLYAWYVAECHKETGIRNWIGAITAIDPLNYRINVDQVNLKLDNIGPPFILYGGKLVRSDGTTIIASGSIQIDWPDLFYLPPTERALTKAQYDIGKADSDARLTPLLREDKFIGFTLALKD